MLLVGYILRAVAALLAWRVGRRWPFARSTFAVLAFGLAADLGQRALASVLGRVPTPYSGPSRVAFHAHQALFLAWPFVVAGFSVSIFTRRIAPVAFVAGVYIGGIIAIVSGYPALRGDDLAWSYALLTVTCVAMSLLGLLAFVVESRVPLVHHVSAMMLMAGLFAVVAGPYLGNAYTDWMRAQVTNAIMSVAIIVVHVRALVRQAGDAAE